MIASNPALISSTLGIVYLLLLADTVPCGIWLHGPLGRAGPWKLRSFDASFYEVAFRHCIVWIKPIVEPLMTLCPCVKGRIIHRNQPAWSTDLGIET